MNARAHSEVREGELRIVFAEGIFGAPPDRAWTPAHVRELFAASPDESWRRVPGRTTFPWPSPSAPEVPRVVVKRARGDVRRERAYDRRRGLGTRTPAQREFEALAGLVKAGFPVPAPILYAERSGHDDSLVVMELVPHGLSLRQAIVASDDPLGRARIEAVRVAELTARLHRAGWYHRDLYLQHLVLRDPTGDLALLDLGRARCEARPRPRWFRKDLAALVASAPPLVREAFRAALLDAYFEGMALSDRSRRRWERAIERRAVRIERHVPRQVDPATREGPGAEADVDGRYLRPR